MNRLLFGIWIALLVASCTGKKYLADGEKFYMGSKVMIQDKHYSQNAKELTRALEEVIELTPNETVLGMRPAVVLHGMVKEPKKEKGLRNFFKNRLGAVPVTYNIQQREKSGVLIENRLFNQGYFHNETYSRTKEGKNETLIIYEVNLHNPFSIKSFTLLNDTSSISHQIKAISDESLVRVGDLYNLETLKGERNRINEYLKNQGFYFFNPDLILFEADSTAGDHGIDITMQLKPQSSPQSTKKFWLDQVTVHPNYQIDKDSIFNTMDSHKINGIGYKDPEQTFRNEIFDPLIKLRPEKLYKISNHQLTLERLSELGIFKYTNIRFKESQDSLIDAHIFLNPQKTISFKFESELNSKSNDFVGPGVSLDLTNRNLFRGAEVLNVTLSGAFETQFNNDGENLNSYEFGTEVGLTIPRLISPIRVKTGNRSQIPKTTMALTNSILQRAEYYKLNKTGTEFGYTWHRSNQVFHKLNVLDLNYIFLAETSDTFEEILESSSSLEESFSDQFIFGGTYSYTYSDKVKNNSRNYLYFNTNLDLSGNLVNLVNQNFTSLNEDGNYELFGVPYAQYAKIDFDIRYFLSFDNDHSLASRLIVGVGVPYGNSDHIPYTKQFSSGGSSSIRAFPARGVGPGASEPSDDSSDFFDQSGDTRFELNLEYRYNIYKSLKGALFVDTGNIWLLNENDDSDDPTEGVFNPDTFYQELAMGTGMGFRLDLSYFILRFDWAFPVKKAYVETSNGWVLDGIDFGSKDWRTDNFTYNIAIGYPF